MDAYASILIGRLEYPVIAADKVAAGHQVARGTFSLQHGPVLRARLDRQVSQVLLNLRKWPLKDLVADLVLLTSHRLLVPVTLYLVHCLGVLLAALKIFEERYKLLEEMFKLWLLSLGHAHLKCDRRVVKYIFVLVLQLLP